MNEALSTNPAAAGRSRALRIAQAVSFATTFAILWTMCRGIFGWLVHSVFNEPREDMAHGWFIPLFTIALFWIKRREMRAAAGAPAPAGLLLAVPGVFFFLVGALGDQARFSLVAAIWLLWAGLYAVWGRRLAREAAFPIAFLLFTMPMGFLDIFTVKLRIVIAAVATTLLNGIGIEMVRVGTGLHCMAGGGFNLDIADPCSGMRSIFALAALTAGYAYLTQRTRLGKWLLFLCSVPLAMLGNLARIFSIAIVAAAFGQKIATGFYHDYSGFVIYLVAVMAMMGVGEFLSRKLKPLEPHGRPAADVAPAEDAGRTRTSRAAAVMAAATLAAFPLLVFAAHLHIRHAPAPAQESDAFVVPEPQALEGYSAHVPYFCQNENCLHSLECDLGEEPPEKCPRCGGKLDSRSRGEWDILPKDTRIVKCNYYDVMGNGWKVSVVVNGRSRQSIHRPELCLPGQGLSIEKGQIENFTLENGDILAMHCLDIRPRSSQSDARMGHGYFFVNPRQRAASHYKRILISVAERVFARRVTRWAMVTVSADEPLAADERRREQTAEFLSALMPAIFRNRPTDQQTNGPTDQQTNRPTDQQTNRPTDQQTNGPTDQRTNGPTDQRTNGPTD